MKRILTKQKKVIRVIAGAKYNDHTEPLFKKLEILKLEDIYKLKLSKYMYELSIGILPEPLMKMIIPNATIHQYLTRNRNNPHIERRRTYKASVAFKHKGPTYWYNIPAQIRECKTIKSFVKSYRTNMLLSYSQH